MWPTASFRMTCKSLKSVLKYIDAALQRCFSIIPGPWTTFLKKFPMDHLAVLTPHEQQVENVLHKVTIFRNVLSRFYGTLCEPLESVDHCLWAVFVLSENYIKHIKRTQLLNTKHTTHRTACRSTLFQLKFCPTTSAKGKMSWVTFYEVYSNTLQKYAWETDNFASRSSSHLHDLRWFIWRIWRFNWTLRKQNQHCKTKWPVGIRVVLSKYVKVK